MNLTQIWEQVGVFNNLLIALSILLATGIAIVAVLIFMWLGYRFALDERVFPEPTEKQRKLFGAFGFCLLALTSLEILNPRDFQALTGDDISFKPGFLQASLFELGHLALGHYPAPPPVSRLARVSAIISFQDALSLGLVAGALIWLIFQVIRLNKSIGPILQRQQQVTPTKARSDSLEPSAKARSKESLAGLRFALQFSAKSLLIALLAPKLASDPRYNLPFLLIFGVFLIGGVNCYIEALRLGKDFKIKRTGFPKAQLFQLFLSSVVLYLAIGLGGAVVYQKLASELGPELAGLIRALTKIVTGVFVMLAAFLVAWGGDGFKSRVNKFMAVVAAAPLLLPTWKLLPAVDWWTLPFTGYALFLLVLTMVIYFVAAQTDEPRGSMPHIAYVRDISWTPFLLGGASPEKYRLHDYATAEQLLEAVIGRTTRAGLGYFLGARQKIAQVLGLEWEIIPWLRHKLSRGSGIHKDYDAIVIDLLSALRLRDACWQQGRVKYFIIAGVCQSKIECLGRAAVAPQKTPLAVWSGQPYMLQHEKLAAKLRECVTAVSQAKSPDMVYLPPDCIKDYFPALVETAFVHEPFATEVKRTAQTATPSYNFLTLTKGTPYFSASDFLKPRDLARQIRDQATPLAKYLYQQLPLECQQLLVEARTCPKQELCDNLVTAFNEVLDAGPLAEVAGLRSAAMSPVMEKLLTQPAGLAGPALNRLVLENAYPKEIAKSQSEWDWLLKPYYVLLVRDLNNDVLSHELVEILLAGREKLRDLRGPAMVEESLARLVPHVDHFSVTQSLLNLDISPEVLCIGANRRAFFMHCHQQLAEAGIIRRLDAATFAREIRPQEIESKLKEEQHGIYPLYLDLILVEDQTGRLHQELARTSTENAHPNFSFLVAQRMGSNSGFIYLLANARGRISKASAPTATKKHIGFIRAELPDKAGRLENMLGVLGKAQINLASCFVYTSSDKKATALISLGDVAQSKIDEALAALGTLEQQGVTVFTKEQNESWLDNLSLRSEA